MASYRELLSMFIFFSNLSITNSHINVTINDNMLLLLHTYIHTYITFLKI